LGAIFDSHGAVETLNSAELIGTLTTTSASSMAGSMAQPIAHLISMKVVEGLVSMLWKRAVVPMSRVETIVHVAVEAM
jgi:hypothetical protein